MEDDVWIRYFSAVFRATRFAWDRPPVWIRICQFLLLLRHSSLLRNTSNTGSTGNTGNIGYTGNTGYTGGSPPPPPLHAADLVALVHVGLSCLRHCMEECGDNDGGGGGGGGGGRGGPTMMVEEGGTVVLRKNDVAQLCVDILGALASMDEGQHGFNTTAFFRF